MSYLEIYNERVRDLLNPSTKGNLKVREHPATGPYVEDLAKLVVRNFAEIDHLMDEGNKARTVAATNMNETSSRSHAVFTLTLSQKRHDVETNMDTEKVAKISLVDLAGSERATSTGATGARLKEGAEINRSLSTLGRVIAALADLSDPKHKKTKGMQVPYRDSVLTWLLKDSLGGNSLTAMIAAISPADINFEETLSTLRYADSAKRIKNHAVVNEDPNARMIRELKEELAQLRAKLGGGGGVGGAAVPGEEQYAPGTPLDQQFVTITNPDGSTKKVSKADIAEQLSQSEKLYSDLNQTWEQKLQTTERIHKEREAALEELGISIEKGNVGLSTPKKMPHLVNLSDDPLLAECLIYNLKPGTTTVGNVESNQHRASSPPAPGINGDDHHHSPDIMLNGSKILHDHCTFENVDGVVTVVPKDGAAVMVNGVRIDSPKRLRPGYRVILGDFHIFRFNHPQEAREERELGEQERGSLLKYSYTADELEDTPSKRPSIAGHERSSSVWSRPMSPDGDSEAMGSGAASPAPWRMSGRDSDWAFARREAASSILGGDRNIGGMTDDELDVLFDDVQRVRAVRRARPESRIFMDGSGIGSGNDTETESVASHPRQREKYLSNGTLDNFSLDTALTIPSTPQQPASEAATDEQENDERLKKVKEEMQQQLEQQKEEYAQKLQSAEEGAVEIEELRRQKVLMETNLQEMKEQMQHQLDEQKREFEGKVAALQKTSPKKKSRRRSSYRPGHKVDLSEEDVYLAQWVLEHWRGQRYVAMAADLLRTASALKEAQVLSQTMGREIVFQYTIVDAGHTLGSSYDLVLNGVSSEESNDTDLEISRKPCIGVRLIDFGRSIIQLWSLEKLHARLKVMRQMQNLMDRGPDITQHFRMDDPFEDDCMPEYTRVGDADIPLAAVFECRVQDFTLDVVSPYTSSVVGIVRLSLEPSSAEAPKETLKFNVVMHDLVGFAEREGTNVHAQLFIPGVSEEGGATTTSLISEFGEGPVRFESVHSMSLPLSAPHQASLRVSVFAQVSHMHLDKLLSWDDIRDSSAEPARRPPLLRGDSRMPEHAYYTEERHDVFARVQILEIGEEGEYLPVEVVQSSTLDQGAYQLHQGLQRRVVLTLTHNSGESLPWEHTSGFVAGNVQLLDDTGRFTDAGYTGQADVPLQLVSPAQVRTNEDGTTSVKVVGQWDSSTHGSVLLDRPTLENRRVQVTLNWQISSPRVTLPMKFTFHLAVQTRPRTWFRQNSLLAQLWHNQRVVHSSASNYSVTLKPSAAKRAGDLWRMDTSGEYISGQEMLAGWAPRGMSLIRDHISLKERQRKVREIEAARGALSYDALSPPMRPWTPNGDGQKDTTVDERQKVLLEKFVDLWQAKIHCAADLALLRTGSTSPPRQNGHSRRASEPATPIPLAAQVEHTPKTPALLKGGWLLSPDPSGSKWIRRFVELRRPYLHLYSSEGDEVAAINITNSRIDSEPQVAKLLQRPNVRLGVWAIYATNKAWLFACRNDKERGEWIWAVDRSLYVGGSVAGALQDEMDLDDDDD